MNSTLAEYNSLELTQMGVLLVGLPVAALVGALIGLAGKWRKGRVVTAALVGLGCSAFVTCVLFLLFVFISWFASDSRRRMLLDLFDAEMGEQLTRSALIATGAISLLAAIGLRLRYRDEATGAAAVSMRQLLLLQVFTFLALGCWTGMRFIAMARVSELERASRKWMEREWGVEGDLDGNPATLRYAAFGPSADYKAFNEALAQAAEEPWLRNVELNWVTSPDRLELHKLAKARSLKSLNLLIMGQPAIVQQNIDDLGKIESLESLWITGGDLYKTDLTPLVQLPRLKSIQFSGTSIDAATFNQLAKSSSLGGISLEYVQFTGPEPIEFPPTLIDLVIHSQAPISIAENSPKKMKQLKRIQMRNNLISSKELEAFSQIPSIETLQLFGLNQDVDLTLLKACTNLRRLEISYARSDVAVESDAIRGGLLELSRLPSLRILNCPADVLFEDHHREMNDRFFALVKTTNDDQTAKHRQALESEIRNLREEFQAHVNKIRSAENLEPLQIEFGSSFSWLPPTRTTFGGKGGGVGS